MKNTMTWRWVRVVVCVIGLFAVAPQILAATASTQNVTVVTAGNVYIQLSGTGTNWTLVTAPQHGSNTIYNGSGYIPWTAGVSANHSGGYVYYYSTPPYTGSDSFTWHAKDASGTSADAVCSITVTANHPPTATPQSVTVQQLSVQNYIWLGYTDADSGQTETMKLVSAPSHGSLYTYNSSYAIVPISVGGAFNNGYSFYTPTPSYFGSDSFTFNVNDGMATSTPATVSITVTPSPAPVATNSTLTTPSGVETMCSLPFTYAGGSSTFTYKLVTAPTHGIVQAVAGCPTLSAGATTTTNPLYYVATAPYTGGPDSFTWNVCDGVKTSNTATVSITVTAALRAQPVFKAGVKLMDGASLLCPYRHKDNDDVKLNDGHGATGYDYINNFGFADHLVFAAPEVVDWNGDGLPDLLVGVADGRVALFLNQGTKGHPVFNGYDFLRLQQGAFVDNNSVGCFCGGGRPMAATPRVVDWDHDGKKDLVLGNWNGGPYGTGVDGSPGVFVFPNIGADNAPVFYGRERCQMSNAGASMSMPCLVDWNGDGMFDVVSSDEIPGFTTGGTPNDKIDVFLSTKNDHRPTSASPLVPVTDAKDIDFDGSPYYIPVDSFQINSSGTTPSLTISNVCPSGLRKSVVMANLGVTGGVKDMVVGMQDGTVWYAPNTGTATAPQFSGYMAMKAGGAPIIIGDSSKVGQDPAYQGPWITSGIYEGGLNVTPVNEARVAVADLDGDGLPDLLVGDVNGNVTVFYQYNPKPVAIDQNVLVYPNHTKNIVLTAKVDSSNAVTYTVLANPTNGNLTGTAPALTYTPNAGYTGPDSFTFQTADGTNVSQAGTIHIAVTNHAPVAQSQIGAAAIVVSMNQSIPVTLAATDTGDEPLTYSFVQPLHGTLTGTAPTNLVYTPATNYTGPDSFTFTSGNGYTNSAVATVMFDVITLAINFGPTSAVVTGYLNDHGALFNATTNGYGWNMNLTSSAQSTDFFVDLRRNSYVNIKSAVATWTCNLPNGNYFVSFACNWSFNIGVTVQGASVVSGYSEAGATWTNPSGSGRAWENIPVTVTNGQLSVVFDTSATSANTYLCYMEIRPAYTPLGHAVFVAQDTTTQGSWKGMYGADGYWMPDSPGYGGGTNLVALGYSSSVDIFKLPAYVINDPANLPAGYPSGYGPGRSLWADPTADARALQHPWDTGRMASGWGSSYGGYVFDLNFIDGQTHRVAIYCLDWNNSHVSDVLSILDGGDGTVLDTRPATNLGNGVWFVWNVAGHVKIAVTSTNGSPIVSGFFFDTLAAAAPTITTQPTNATVFAGQTATFNVNAMGAVPLWYQWFKNGTAIPGAISMSYTTPIEVTGDNGALFSVSVSNTLGSATSASAMLTVNAAIAPVIAASPTNTAVVENQAATFSVSVTGTTPLWYQWLKNGVAIPSATTASYTTPNEVLGDNGAQFSVIVSNVAGSATSAAATMTVIPGPPLSATGGYTITNYTENSTNFVAYIFTNNGSFIILGAPTVCDLLVIGGGAGGCTGGGGAGGYVFSNQVPLGVGFYTVTIGTGGVGTAYNVQGGNGSNSSFGTIIAYGGGGGGILATGNGNGGASGGGGGGSSGTQTYGGTNVFGAQGQPGGKNHPGGNYPSGGGGGAGGPGADGATGNVGGTGGVGITNTMSGVATGYAGGGGGDVWYGGTPGGASCGGGGGAGAAATKNTGGGGGGGAGTGGSGIVIIRVNTSLTNQTALAITAQPANVTVTVGQTATFSVSAIGVAPLLYQWRTNAVNIGGATNASYTTPATTLADNGKIFSVVVNNATGSVTSANATLTVNAATVAPTITAQPTNVTVNAGQTATFSVTATGTAPLLYQWRTNAVNIGGATNASYTTPATTLTDNGKIFSVVVTNAAGSVTSSNATLTVNAASVAPTITAQPTNATVLAGQTATFSVTATGTAPLWYQWRKDGVNIGGATSASYTTTATVTNDNGAQFSVVVSNVIGNVTSVTVALTVTAPVAPAITAQPANATVTAGQTATFNVTATGTAPLSYQWRKGGVNIGGATSASYTTTATVTNDNGAQFSVVVTNVAGGATSASATLTVNANVAAAVAATGGYTVTNYTENSTNFTAYIFTNNGSFIISNNALTCDLLVVGGGGGGNAGGGGAGGYAFSNQMAVAAGTYTVTIGAGGSGGKSTYAATNGTNSAFGTIIAYGGGAGGMLSSGNGNDGASGGGGGGSSGTALYGGTNLWGTSQGYPGGGNLKGGNYPAGGGGGAGARGADGATGNINGNGGVGKTNTLSGVVTGYAGGGGGAGYYNPNTPGSASCGGGAGSASVNGANGANGVVNTGGGGGGSCYGGGKGGNGGSGIVIIRFDPAAAATAPAITAQPANATVTAGQTATFSVTASGTAPLRYQWRTNAVNIANATNFSYTTPTTTMADNGKLFSVIVSNVAGSVTSGNATLTVTPVVFSQSAKNISGGWGMDFMTMNGVQYDVMWRTNLLSGSWLVYTNFIGDGNDAHIVFTNAVPQGFFEILVAP